MPLPNLLRKAAKVTEKGFRIKSKLLYEYETKKGDSKLYLLKNKPRNGNPFTLLGVVNNYGLADNLDFRNRNVFEVATLDKTFGINRDESFSDAIQIATHVALHPQGRVFSIREGNELMIAYLNFSWKISGWLTSDEFNANDYVNLAPSIPLNFALDAITGGLRANWSSSTDPEGQSVSYSLELSFPE